MSESYTLIPNLLEQIAVQSASIVSKTLFADDRLKAVTMALDTGQELSEHTAAVPAVVHLLSGKATLSLGADTHVLAAGAWLHMPAKMPHSVLAHEPTVLLLLLIKSPSV
ncbi:MAG: cupin domain-containing protein [Candidatus Hydrogenedentes bacterium]|nr:cupin domain-containing protein [Candidatus Hydrogenedentota bacterium]